MKLILFICLTLVALAVGLSYFKRTSPKPVGPIPATAPADVQLATASTPEPTMAHAPSQQSSALEQVLRNKMPQARTAATERKQLSAPTPYLQQILNQKY